MHAFNKGKLFNVMYMCVFTCAQTTTVNENVCIGVTHCCESLKSTILSTPFSLLASLNGCQNISFPALVPLTTQFPHPGTPNPPFHPQNSYPFLKAYSFVHSLIQEKPVCRMSTCQTHVHETFPNTPR